MPKVPGNLGALPSYSPCVKFILTVYVSVKQVAHQSLHYDTTWHSVYNLL